MRRRGRLDQVALTGYAGFVAFSAYLGAVGMIAGYLPVPPTLASRLPFQSPVFGGIALGCVVAVPATVVAVLAWRRDARAGRAATVAGVLLVGWIVVELAVVRQLSGLQLVYFLAGLGLIHIGTRPLRRPADEVCAGTDAMTISTFERRTVSGIDLYWLPLGAGGRSVRWNGRLYEAIAAWHEHRPAKELYHCALEVVDHGRRYVIELAPVWNEAATERGVVAEGPVGARWLGRFRAFRYEVRCWRDGRIPDLAEAVAREQLDADADRVAAVLDAVGRAPTLTWGRDELGCGDMWNSNSLVAWLLAGTGHDLTRIRPPDGGRAPGWRAGLALAARQGEAVGSSRAV